MYGPKVGRQTVPNAVSLQVASNVDIIDNLLVSVV